MPFSTSSEAWMNLRLTVLLMLAFLSLNFRAACHSTYPIQYAQVYGHAGCCFQIYMHTKNKDKVGIWLYLYAALYPDNIHIFSRSRWPSKRSEFLPSRFYAFRCRLLPSDSYMHLHIQRTVNWWWKLLVICQRSVICMAWYCEVHADKCTYTR